MKTQILTKEMIYRASIWTRNGKTFTCAADRFWNSTLKSMNIKCWNWLGTISNKGYGSLGLCGSNYQSHRVSWVIHYGEIPDELCVCHHCDNPSCVNPLHLFIGTEKDNTTDAVRKGRLQNYTWEIGEKNNLAKLTTSQVIKIRELYKNDAYNQTELGKMFNISNHAIYRIVHRYTWKHI